MKWKRTLWNPLHWRRTGKGLAASLNERTIFSFVVDSAPRFAYQGYHLARSLIAHCGTSPHNIHVQFTREVPEWARNSFGDLGCVLHEIERFGDGKYCNKIAQLDNLLNDNYSRLVLLDTDMIAVSDVRPHICGRHLQAKVVDMSNPSIGALEEIARRAGMKRLPSRTETEARDGDTFLGNCNGGFYAIPRELCDTVAKEWRRWALWLLANIEPLAREGKEAHVDQVAMWLTIHMGKLPFRPASPSVNYFVHFGTETRKPVASIALLHYHANSINVQGLIEPPIELSRIEKDAVDNANRLITEGFDNRLFWNLRYSSFQDRGSGVGSRGANLLYKRELLRLQGGEQAESVLDVGCGDLEVVKALNLKRYVGVDRSEEALRLARSARPDWSFIYFGDGDSENIIPSADFVICFEVLIHQPTAEAYHGLLELLAARTRKTLLVSGYDDAAATIVPNHMLFYYEMLERGLRRTKRFRSIRCVGAHTGVSIYRCEI